MSEVKKFISSVKTNSPMVVGHTWEEGSVELFGETIDVGSIHTIRMIDLSTEERARLRKIVRNNEPGHSGRVDFTLMCFKEFPTITYAEKFPDKSIAESRDAIMKDYLIIAQGDSNVLPP